MEYGEVIFSGITVTVQNIASNGFMHTNLSQAEKYIQSFHIIPDYDSHFPAHMGPYCLGTTSDSSLKF